MNKLDAWTVAKRRVSELEIELTQARQAEEVLRFAAVPTDGLSPRRAQVLRLVHQHLQNKEIASILNISVRTAKFHVSWLLQRFHVTDRHELMRITPSV